MGKWVNGFWDQQTQLLGTVSVGTDVRWRWDRIGQVGGGLCEGQEFSLYMFEVQGVRFTTLTLRWSCHGGYLGPMGLFLMAALRTGFQLIISANLPQGQRTRKHRSRLKAELVERHGRLFLMHGTFSFFDGGERKRREFILEVFDKWAPHHPALYHHPHPGHPISTHPSFWLPFEDSVMQPSWS